MKLSRAALVGALVLSAAACGGSDNDADGSNAPSAKIDTTNSDLLDGASTRQVEADAEAMTPEQAEARGMVDTTIHLENLSSSDTTPPGATIQDPARPGGQAAGRTDTVPPRPETNPPKQ